MESNVEDIAVKILCSQLSWGEASCKVVEFVEPVFVIVPVVDVIGRAELIFSTTRRTLFVEIGIARRIHQKAKMLLWQLARDLRCERVALRELTIGTLPHHKDFLQRRKIAVQNYLRAQLVHHLEGAQ